VTRAIPASTAMPSAHTPGADEQDVEPAEFLRSLRELSEKRDREDAERYRKLEEEVEQSRRERAARRAGTSIFP
jgi:hypothetical protein